MQIITLVATLATAHGHDGSDGGSSELRACLSNGCSTQGMPDLTSLIQGSMLLNGKMRATTSQEEKPPTESLTPQKEPPSQPNVGTDEKPPTEALTPQKEPPPTESLTPQKEPPSQPTVATEEKHPTESLTPQKEPSAGAIDKTPPVPKEAERMFGIACIGADCNNEGNQNPQKEQTEPVNTSLLTWPVKEDSHGEETELIDGSSDVGQLKTVHEDKTDEASLGLGRCGTKKCNTALCGGMFPELTWDLKKTASSMFWEDIGLFESGTNKDWDSVAEVCVEKYIGLFDKGALKTCRRKNSEQGSGETLSMQETCETCDCDPDYNENPHQMAEESYEVTASLLYMEGVFEGEIGIEDRKSRNAEESTGCSNGQSYDEHGKKITNNMH